MRVIKAYEQKQRGCAYCADENRTSYKGEIRVACPHDECPHHVLDKYETYEKFMASEDSKILVTEFFTSVPGGFELHNRQKSSNKAFSDGDAKIDM